MAKNTILPIDVENAMEQMQKIQKANADFLQSLAKGQMELVNELIEGTMKHFDSIKNAKNVQEMVELQNQYLSDSAKKITTLGKKFFDLYVSNQPKLIDILPTASVSKPVAKKPAAKPVTKKPVAKPAAKKPAAKPAAKKPVAKPAAKKPVAKPAAKKPVAKPAEAKKTASRKIEAKPATPAAEKPAAAKPTATKPAAE